MLNQIFESNGYRNSLFIGLVTSLLLLSAVLASAVERTQAFV